MTIRRYKRILEVLHKRQPDLTVLAEDVYKPHNLSAMLRSCDAVGIGKVSAVTPTGGIPTYNETSGSAEKWVELEVYSSIDTAVETLKSQNMQVYAAHFSDEAVDYRDVDYTLPCCILLGNERSGVTDKAAALADKHIIIPMLGMVQSLNVSVATAVILFEAQRQRRDAGLYEQARLTDKEMNDYIYTWLYPKEAAMLRANNQIFPTVREEDMKKASSQS